MLSTLWDNYTHLSLTLQVSLEDMGNKILWETIEQQQTYLHNQASQVKTPFSSAATVTLVYFQVSGLCSLLLKK